MTETAWLEPEVSGLPEGSKRDNFWEMEIMFALCMLGATNE